MIKRIKDKFRGYDWVDCSGGNPVSCTYLLKSKADRMYVKISNREAIKHEYDILQYLQGRLPVPEVIEYAFDSDYGYIVMTALSGINFKEYLPKITPDRAVEIYAAAYKILRSTNITHGDFCPLNIIVDSHGSISGFVDFEKSTFVSSQRDLKEIDFIITKHYGNEYLEKFYQILRS